MNLQAADDEQLVALVQNLVKTYDNILTGIILMLEDLKGDKGNKGDKDEVGPEGKVGPEGQEGKVGEMGPQGITGKKLLI